MAGRAALLAKLREIRAAQVGITPAASTSEPEPSVSPPRPTGRAALLEKIRESRLKKVGVDPEVVTSEVTSSVHVTTAPPAGQDNQHVSLSSQVEHLTIQEEEEKKVTFSGTAGRQVKLTSNYIKLMVDKDRGVFEYEVRFEPNVDARNVRIRMVNSHMEEMGKTKMFDGGSCLYLPKLLPEKVTTFPCKLPDNEPVTMSIIFKRKRLMKDCLHFYNLLFKSIMRVLLFTRIGRNYFNMKEKFMVPQYKLEVYPGFAVTVDELESGLLVSLDSTHRVLRSQNVLDFMEQLHGAPNFIDLVRNEVIGAVVLTRYNNKSYTIDDIAWDITPKDKFQSSDGSSISFTDYYKKQYDITIRDHGQPMLIHRKSIKTNEGKVDNMICLIPELSFLTGLSDTMRDDFRVMKEVSAYTRVTPAQRMNALRTYLRNVSSSPEATQILKNWGLQLEDHSVSLTGRLLDNETVLFGGGREIRTRNNADWTKAAGENNMTLPVDLKNWIIFYTDRDERHAKKLAQTLTRVGPSLGAEVVDPKMVKVKDDRNDSYVSAIKNNIHSGVQCGVFICPTLRSDRYSIIKKICCTELGVPSQVILSKTLSNESKYRGIIQKIALQINCKLGGSLWTLRFPFKRWMIVGIDVFHGAKGSRDDSIISMVSSMNESITKWFSIALPQKGEISNFYNIMLSKTLENFHANNKCYPEKIVVFRDGVGDGQLDYVKNFEIKQMEATISNVCEETKVSFVVVQKRISTKIYWQNGSDLVNPEPGTVLDHTVTRKTLTDFFLVPQNVRQGTVNPTHYIVLHNNCNLTPDQSQRLSYKLCHLYYNWTGTIRVPAPCQYAHKCAQLYGQHLKKPVSSLLTDKLYYL